jgi:hypothetical protein
MRFIVWNMGLSTWLLLSAFALGHSPGSAAITGLLAVLIATFALASPGFPGLRFANTAFALILGFAALLAPDVSMIARLNNAIVAAIVFALSVVPGRSTEIASADVQPKP